MKSSPYLLPMYQILALALTISNDVLIKHQHLVLTIVYFGLGMTLQEVNFNKEILLRGNSPGQSIIFCIEVCFCWKFGESGRIWSQCRLSNIFIKKYREASTFTCTSNSRFPNRVCLRFKVAQEILLKFTVFPTFTYHMATDIRRRAVNECSI